MDAKGKKDAAEEIAAQHDKAYGEVVTPRAIGHLFGEIFGGLMDKGLTRNEALVITAEYAKSFGVPRGD